MRRQQHRGIPALASQWLMQGAAWLLGGLQAPWARAMQAEVAAIDDEREALAFAWGCFCAALGQALAQAVASCLRPHAAGVLACMAAVLLGCVFMHLAGAPGRYIGMNLLALGIGVTSLRLLPLQRLQADGLLRARLVLTAGALLLVASLGAGAGGAAAWVHFGPVHLNLVWLLLPALLVASNVGPLPGARRRAMVGLLMAVVALGLQADALLAGLMAVVLGLRAWHTRSLVTTLMALLSCGVALHAAPGWRAADAVPFVDLVLQSGFEHHAAFGMAMALLLMLPLAPALRHRAAREQGVVWGLLVALSLPGWMPSPLVGFGGSLILGYLLSLAVVPGKDAAPPLTHGRPDSPSGRQAPPAVIRSGTA